MASKEHSGKTNEGKFIFKPRFQHVPEAPFHGEEHSSADAETFTFERLFQDYLPAVRNELRGFFRVETAYTILSASFAGRDLAKLKRSDISGHITRRRRDGIQNATINRELDVLSAAINYAVKHWEWEIPNPVRGMSLKMPEGRLRWLTREEAARLTRAADQGMNHCLGDFIRLALNTGMRMNEMLKLEWNRVDMEARRIRLDGIHTKSGRRRFVPLNESALQVLRSRLEFRMRHCPLSPWVFAWEDGRRVTRLWEQFQTATKRAGIDDFRIHDLRHTFASWLVSAGVPLTEVRDLLGHASVRETERYAHLAPDRLNNAVAILDFQEAPLRAVA